MIRMRLKILTYNSILQVENSTCTCGKYANKYIPAICSSVSWSACKKGKKSYWKMKGLHCHLAKCHLEVIRVDRPEEKSRGRKRSKLSITNSVWPFVINTVCQKCIGTRAIHLQARKH